MSEDSSENVLVHILARVVTDGLCNKFYCRTIDDSVLHDINRGPGNKTNTTHSSSKTISVTLLIKHIYYDYKIMHVDLSVDPRWNGILDVTHQEFQ